jgi:hypothetical protein
MLLKKQKLFVVVFMVLLLVGLLTITSYFMFNQEKQKPFYVGVTYCGCSVEEAKELVDRVKDYTNLFVLQSGPLMDDIEAMEAIGDYVVASNLNYAVYHSVHEYVGLSNQVLGSWLISAKERWGEQFNGIYFGDELGGDMLDGKGIDLESITTRQKDGTVLKFPTISKERGYIFVITIDNRRGDRTFSSYTTYYDNGEISIVNFFDTIDEHVQDSATLSTSPLLRASSSEFLSYYPNGTITLHESIDRENYTFYTTENNNITKYPWPLLSYEQASKQKPMQTYDESAQVFVNMHKQNLESINKKQLAKKSITVFTADYGLYWWDYKGGYDVVLAELAWNLSDVQQIGLVRGAANLQGKSWGTILTWKYTHPPFLTDGAEMFEQMKMSYEAGAEYVLIFNYSEDPANPNTLQEEHFLALERFWKDVVQNSEVVHGGIKAEAALVLPKNYGYGMRGPTDVVWGMWWPKDDTSQEIWNQLQNKIDQHGLKLDIVFEDQNCPPLNYKQIYYWNQK